jgi:hypothetical protein
VNRKSSIVRESQHIEWKVTLARRYGRAEIDLYNRGIADAASSLCRQSLPLVFQSHSNPMA